MAFEDFDDTDTSFDGSASPEESSNRTFMIAVGALGGVAVLALLCIAAYAFLVMPMRRNLQSQQVAKLNAQNTTVAQAITQTSIAAAATFTPTVTPVPPTATPTSTPTAVVVVATRAPTENPRTATVAALLTEQARITQTRVPTETALPSTGFAEDLGLPAMLGMAFMLVGIIYVARRLRTT
jgi:carbohydrate-binding DOMON domain-containing protein